MTGWLGWLRVAMAPHILSASSHWFLAAVAAGVMLKALFDHLLRRPLAAVFEVLPLLLAKVALVMTGWLGWLQLALTLALHVLLAPGHCFLALLSAARPAKLPEAISSSIAAEHRSGHWQLGLLVVVIAMALHSGHRQLRLLVVVIAMALLP